MTPANYLTENGKKIFKLIAAHCKTIDKGMEIFSFEASILANSLDLYARAAKTINESNSYAEKTKTGWQQISADYTVLNKEAQNIMKHAPKFGLNPKDLFAKIEMQKNAESRVKDLL